MIFIAHRGNMTGPNERRENDPEYIKEALDAGFDVEVDIRLTQYRDGCSFALGHDLGKYRVSEDFLKTTGLWCHAKTIETLYALIRKDIHCFYNMSDSCSLTSEGYIWSNLQSVNTFEGVIYNNPANHKIYNIKYDNIGFCSDYVKYLKEDWGNLQ